MSTSQRAVMPCGWGVKAGMVCVWVADKTVWSPYYTRPISECYRDKGLIKCCITSPSLFTLFMSTFTTVVQLDTKMNWLDVEVERSKIQWQQMWSI